jgi:hypothetical protein
MGRRGWPWFAIFFTFGVAGVLLLIAGWQVQSHFHWERNSIPVNATVIDSVKRTGYHCLYRFQTASGETVTTWEKLGHRQKTAAGTTAAIRYSVSDPSFVRNDIENWYWWPAILTGTALLWVWTMAKNLRRSPRGAEEMVRPRIRKLPR